MNADNILKNRCVIQNCEECPMFYDGRKFNDHDRLICNHPDAPYQLPTPLEPIPKVKPIEIDDSGEDLSYIQWVVTPDWCPLKSNPLLIEYKE